jgi:hypothetical protein
MAAVFLQNSSNVSGHDGQRKNIVISAAIPGPGTCSLATPIRTAPLAQWIDATAVSFRRVSTAAALRSSRRQAWPRDRDVQFRRAHQRGGECTTSP